jgi:hypothetical protein
LQNRAEDRPWTGVLGVRREGDFSILICSTNGRKIGRGIGIEGGCFVDYFFI